MRKIKTRNSSSPPRKLARRQRTILNLFWLSCLLQKSSLMKKFSTTHILIQGKLRREETLLPREVILREGVSRAMSLASVEVLSRCRKTLHKGDDIRRLHRLIWLVKRLADGPSKSTSDLCKVSLSQIPKNSNLFSYSSEITWQGLEEGGRLYWNKDWCLNQISCTKIFH